MIEFRDCLRNVEFIRMFSRDMKTSQITYSHLRGMLTGIRPIDLPV